jgi:hypothetical protein
MQTIHRGAALIVGMLALVAVADAETVRGELWFDLHGNGKVSECRSGRVLTLGEMTPNRFLDMTATYWRLSYHGKTPVLIDMRGAVTRKGPPGTELTLQSPNVVALIGGRC